MKQITKEELANLRAASVGKRIEFVSHSNPDPAPLTPGLFGTCYAVDDLGTLQMQWDDGRVLGLAHDADVWKVLGDAPTPARHQCDNCQQVWDGDAILPLSESEVEGLLDRLDPGGIVPSGECPECHALVYLEYVPVECRGDKSAAIPCGISLSPSYEPGFHIPGGHGLYGSGASARLDFYNGKAQILVDDSHEDVALHIRLNVDGTIAEILVRDDLLPLIVGESAFVESPWQAERDAESLAPKGE